MAENTPPKVTPRLALWIAQAGRKDPIPALQGLLALLALLISPLSLIPRALALALIRIYKKIISPILPPACRFHPTCSVYAFGCLEQHGILRGSILAIYRILRCQPFARPGYDPVPSINDGQDHDPNQGKHSAEAEFP